MKAIARHSFTGLNIIIFHDGLFNILYCHYNKQENLENNYKTSFWKSQHFFTKSERTYMLGAPSSPCSFLFAFQWPPPLPSSTNGLFEWPLSMNLSEAACRSFLWKSYSLKFCNIRWKVVDLQIFKKKLQHNCFPINTVNFLRAPTLKKSADNGCFWFLKQLQSIGEQLLLYWIF